MHPPGGLSSYNLLTSKLRPRAADYRGEILAATNHFNSADRVMTASVPVRGVPTLYALVGDAFAWLAALCLLTLTALALLRPQRPGLL